MMARAAVWSACMAVLLYLPLQAAALAQRVQVNRMVEKITRAEKESVGYRKGRWDDRVLLAPEVSDNCAGCQNNGLLVDFQTTVYVAVFAPGPDTPDVEICYDGDLFSNPTRPVLGPGAPCEVSYCFPVFEPTVCNGWARFAGLAVPQAQADRFRGFYRINHPETLELLVNMTIPADRQRMLFRQHAVWPWHGNALPEFPGDGHKGEVIQMQAKARGFAAENKWSDALAAWEATAARRPALRMPELGCAEAMDHLQRPAEALDLFTALLNEHPGEGLASRLVDDTLSRSRSPEERLAAWAALAERLPGHACVQRYAAGPS